MKKYLSLLLIIGLILSPFADAGRNGSGSYSLPGATNPVVSGTTISSAWANSTLSDVAAELTNSVAVDGQSVMTGQLKLKDGTNGSPAWTFGSESTTGMYRKSAGVLGISIGGLEKYTVSATAITLPADPSAALHAATKQYVDAAITTISVPTGTLLDFAGATPPSGFLPCDGSAISRTTYAALFAAIGTTWGAGNGSTTFNVPDFRRRVTVGSGGTGTATLGNALGNTGGAETHVMSLAEMPTHNHTINDPGHHHTYSALLGAGGVYSGGDASIITANTGNSTTGITINNAGSSTAFTLMQPSAVVLKIIKTEWVPANDDLWSMPRAA